jgi:bacillithiol system protein YtxJ
MKKLNSIEDVNNISATTYFILKNSTTCPISQAAFEEFEKFASDLSDEVFFYLNVQDTRDLSNQLADVYNIKHESPQVLLVNSDSVVWHDSHWNITYSKLTEVWDKYF